MSKYWDLSFLPLQWSSIFTVKIINLNFLKMPIIEFLVLIECFSMILLFMWVEYELLNTNYTTTNWIFFSSSEIVPILIPIVNGNGLLLWKNQKKTIIFASISSLCPYANMVKVSSLFCDLVTNRDRLIGMGNQPNYGWWMMQLQPTVI